MYSSWRIILFLSTIVITSTSDEISGPLPIIGGACKVNSPDIPIGGKQTQFYLKCELNQQAQDGSGIWVVRSGASSTDQNYPSSAQTGSTYVESPNICVEDKNSKENEPCSVSETCLQSNENDPSTYLQCDLSSRRWMKKSCIGGSLFKFNLQNCEVQQSSQPAFMIMGEMVRRTYVREADFPEAEDCNLEKRCSHKLNWLNFIAFRRQDPRRARGPSNSVRFAPRAEQILKSNRECKVVRYSCSLEDPCFENSDCFDGRCCEIYTNRSCPDGSVPLSFPEKCVIHLSNCPLGTFCFEEKCCSFMVIENRSDFESISNKESNNESTFLKVSHQNAMSTKISDKSDNRILQANQVEYYSGLPDTVFQPKMKGKEAT